MTTPITKEWLQKAISEMEAARDDIPFGLDEEGNNTLLALKMALTSLSAEPVGEVSEQPDGLVMDGIVHLGGSRTHRVIKGLNKMKRFPLGTKFYAAPPAPVVDAEPVADVVAWHKEGEERTCDIRWRRFDVAPGPLFAVAQPVVVVPDEMAISDDMNLYQKSFAQGHNACRVAMLNHSEVDRDMVEPVSQPYKLSFDQWMSQQEGSIDVECGCVMTEVLFHWMRVAYEAGNSPVIPDGWKLVPVEPTLEMIKSGANAASTGMLIPGMYRAMLAAAPRQEGK